jgi:hypothetical protein
MVESLGPSEQESIQNVNEKLVSLIEAMESGSKDEGSLFYIGQELSLLSQSNTIPDSVKLKLQAALKDLQTEAFTSLSVKKVMAAKKELDEILEKNPDGSSEF